MSAKELNKFEVIQGVIAKRLTQKQAAKILGISDRQVRRTVKTYKLYGAIALVSKKRGKPSNHQLQEGLVDKITSIIREKYWDFSPTLATEFLFKRHQIKVSITAVSLTVFIDDATGRVLHAQFDKAETTFAYLSSLSVYLQKYGKCAAIYRDRHSIFRNNNKLEDGKPTQFGRALKELGIINIFAMSAEAKGRVERLNQTWQDRLIKSMRVDNITGIEAGNKYLLDYYIEDHNKHFAVEARDPLDTHIPLNEIELKNLDLILSKQVIRKVQKNLTLQYKNKLYQILLAG